jgi:hypothetical protein
MRMRPMLRYVAAGGLALASTGPVQSAKDGFHKLSDAQLRRFVAGKSVTDDVHYTDYLKPDGTYEGVFMNRRATGIWTVRGGQLCIARGASAPDCDEIWQSRENPKRFQRRKPGLYTDEIFIRSK